METFRKFKMETIRRLKLVLKPKNRTPWVLFAASQPPPGVYQRWARERMNNVYGASHGAALGNVPLPRGCCRIPPTLIGNSLNGVGVRCPCRATYILLVCLVRHRRLLTYGLLVAAWFTMAWLQGPQPLVASFI